jgi:hypothetical protein
MFGLGNWIKESVSSGGTGNLTVASVTGFDTFASQFGDGTTTPPAAHFRYVVTDGNDWETGVGHMSAVTTLVRDLIEMKIASGTLTRFPATGLTVSTSAFVFCDFTGDGSELPYWPDAASATAGLGVPPQNVGAYSTSTRAYGAKYFFYFPFKLPLSGVYSAINWEQSASGGTQLQLAIYQVGSDGYPGNMLASIPSTTTSATGWNQTSFSASIYLKSNCVYWLGLTQEAADTWYTLNGIDCTPPIYHWATGANANNIALRILNGSYTALPDPATAKGSLTWGNDVNQYPKFGLRRTA